MGGNQKGYAHRLSWELENQASLLPATIVRHAVCHNPLCVRPDHLLLGTHADNVADRVKAGRSTRGGANGRAKLTWDAVASIRQALAAGHAVTALAGAHNVNQRTIEFIKSGRTWRNV